MMERTVDLCVIGSAASGMSCAVRAKELGVENVLLLEKNGGWGGCSKMSGGILGFGSPVQERQGDIYSTDDAFLDVIRNLNWYVDAKLVRKWINGTGENIRWLEGLGVVFGSAIAWNDRPDTTRHAYHMAVPDGGKFTGFRIMEALYKKFQEQGSEIMLKTRAEHLLQDEFGAVVGVTAHRADGEEVIVHAKYVMIATGSMGANREMIAEFFHSNAYDNMAIMSSFPFLTGDGVKMADEVGAKRGITSVVPIGPHNHFKGASEVVGAITRRAFGIKVNTNGERFVNEDLCSENEYGWMLSAAIDYQPNKMSYTIIDQSILDYMIEKREEEVFCVDFGAISANQIETFGSTEEVFEPGDVTSWITLFPKHVRQEEEAGRAKVCGSIEEVAEYIGCDVKTIKETIDNYNAGCAAGKDEEFLKAVRFLKPLTTAPFYVLDGPAGIDSVVGGIQVDNHNRVVKPDGKAIPGLFAGGVTTSGWLNGLYAYFGSEMSYSVFSGRNAAAEIAKALGK